MLLIVFKKTQSKELKTDLKSNDMSILCKLSNTNTRIKLLCLFR